MQRGAALFIATFGLGCVLQTAGPPDLHCLDMRYENKVQMLALLRIANVGGLVTDWTGDPLPRACVGLFSDAAEPKLIESVSVGRDGRFSFGDVPDGDYRFASSFTGMCPIGVRLRVSV